MTSAAEILAARKPASTTVRLLLDGDLQEEIRVLKERLKVARKRDIADGEGLGSEAPQIEQLLREAEARADEIATEFHFRAVPRSRLAELKEAHPPTEAQWERFREQAKVNPFIPAPEFDLVSLAPVLISASSFDPSFTEAEAAELWDGLSEPDAEILFDAAWRVNQTASPRPIYGTGTDTTPSSGPDSTTPANAESPSLSSTDE